jgi:hypothetical protein
MAKYRDAKEELNEKMAERVREALKRCDDADEEMRDWFDDTMALVWFVEEVPRGAPPNAEERKEYAWLIELWREKWGAKPLTKKPPTALSSRLWRF